MIDELIQHLKSYLLLSATYDEILSWMIDIWVEKSLGKLAVGDTTPVVYN